MPSKKRRLKAGIPKKILAFESKGLKQAEIADALNRKGLFDQNGQPWTQPKVSIWLRANGRRRVRKHERPGKRAPKLQFELPIEKATPKRRKTKLKKRVVKSTTKRQVQIDAKEKATVPPREQMNKLIHNSNEWVGHVESMDIVPQKTKPSLWQSIKQFFTKPLF